MNETITSGSTPETGASDVADARVVAESVLTRRDLQHVSELDMLALDSFLSIIFGNRDPDVDDAVEGSAEAIAKVSEHATALLDKCLSHWKINAADVGLRLTLKNFNTGTLSLLCTFENLKNLKK